MTRDEGPPEDDQLDRESPSPDELTRGRPRPVVHRDGAQDREAPPGMPSKRFARGTSGDAQSECTKPEAWIDAFAAQCTPDLRESLYRYAARLLSGARKVSADSSAAQELVQAAIHDMLNRNDHWNFAEDKLGTYLKSVIRRQVLADFKRATRLPHVSIDELTATGQPADPEMLEQSLRHERPDPRDLEYARRKVALLRSRAAGDSDVLALIEAKLDDRTSRADVMEVTGFSPQRYRAAVARLNRLAHELATELDLHITGEERT